MEAGTDPAAPLCQMPPRLRVRETPGAVDAALDRRLPAYPARLPNRGGQPDGR